MNSDFVVNDQLIVNANRPSDKTVTSIVEVNVLLCVRFIFFKSITCIMDCDVVINRIATFIVNLLS